MCICCALCFQTELSRQYLSTSPTATRPTILVPPIEQCTTGMFWANSACCDCCRASVLLLHVYANTKNDRCI